MDMQVESLVKKFNIYHPLEGKVNITCLLEEIAYELVATIEAQNLVCSYYRAQTRDAEYAELAIRNTTIGDIISDNKNIFIVTDKGFKPLKTKQLLGTNVLELDKTVLDYLNKQILENPEDLISMGD